MGNQYYAILMRDTELNDDTISQEEYNSLAPEEIVHATTRVISTNTNYTEICNEFKKLKEDYSLLKALAEKNSGRSVNFDLEICIVRISSMKDWEALKQ